MLACKFQAARGALLAIALCSGAPASLAAAQDQQEDVPAEAAAEAEVEGDEHGHGAFYAKPTFWAACINFTLLLLVLRRLAARPVSTFLVDRRRVMESSIEEAAQLRAKAEALHREYSERIAQLDAELKKLREDIARAAEDDKKRIVAEAEETATRLRRETEGLIEQHAKALSANVRREVVDAAVSAAEQLLRGTLNDADQQRLAGEFKQSVTGSKSVGGRS